MSDCTERPRLRQPNLAFSFFYGYVTAGLDAKETETMCVLTAWCIGMKVANDQCAHMLKKHGEKYNIQEYSESLVQEARGGAGIQ